MKNICSLCRFKYYGTGTLQYLIHVEPDVLWPAPLQIGQEKYHLEWHYRYNLA